MRGALFLLLSLLPAATVAQANLVWPRNPATHAIEFTGQLSWPATVHTDSQRRVLVWRWYRKGLTSDGPAGLREIAQQEGTTYAGLPAASCYQLRIANPDNEQYRLCFQLQLLPDSTGLRYKLTKFELHYWGFDVGTSVQLEDDQRLPDARTQVILANFQRRLLVALKSW